MSNRRQQTTMSNPAEGSLIEGRVFSVILDSSHKFYKGEDSIGVIFYGDVSANISDEVKLRKLNRAKPYFSFMKQYPLKHEIVQIVKLSSDNPYTKLRGDRNKISHYYFPPTNTHNNSNHNATPTAEDIPTPRENSQEAALGIQQNTVTKTTTTQAGGLSGVRVLNEETSDPDENNIITVTLTLIDNQGNTSIGVGRSQDKGIAERKARSKAERGFAQTVSVTTEEIPSDLELKLGDDFEENPQRKKLQPFEGDTIIEGRHGQAIRMGSTSRDKDKNNWSDNDSVDESVLTISNGLPQTEADATIEDINKTDAVIVMTSNSNINNIEVASDNLQSLGVEYEEPSGEDIIIEDTPEPEVVEVKTQDPVLEEEFTESTGSIEEVIITETPSEEDTADSFFDLLDEAIEEGEIDKDDSYSFEDAGQEGGEDPEADPELDENKGDNGENGGGGDEDGIRVETRGDFKLEFKSGRTDNFNTEGHSSTDNYVNGVYWARVNEINISKKRNLMLWTRDLDNIWVGDGRYVGKGEFDKKPLKANPGSRNIKYLFIHWTGGRQNKSAAQACVYGHIQPDFHDSGKQRIDGSVKDGNGVVVYDIDGTTEVYRSQWQRNGWNAGGYHWGIEKDGRSFRFYEDYQTTNGVTGFNKKSININWIGGRNNNFSHMTLEQAKAIEGLVREYIRIYPDIKVAGHYQATRKKICPGFWVPAFVKGLGFPDKNIYWDSPYFDSDKKSGGPGKPTLLENAKTMLERLHYTWDPSFEFRDGAS